MNDPFERLTRSHRRLEERLRDLLDAARDDGLDEIGAREVADFLGRQVKRHEADEEASLFPRLSGIDEVASVIARLREEHVTQATLHEDLERALVRSASHSPDPHEVRRIAIALEDAYRTHIDVEEAVLFPAARRALSSDDLATISEEMRARRDDGAATTEGGGRRGDRR